MAEETEETEEKKTEDNSPEQGDLKNNAEENNFERYDFSRPSRIPEEHTKTLTLLHETYCVNLTSSLSSLLQADIEVEFEGVEQVPFSEYIMGLSSPTCMTVFDMQPLNGYGVLEVNSALIYLVINKMLGGDGTVPEISRSFTDLEIAISRKFVKTLLKDLAHAWSTLLKISFSIKEIVTNPALVRAIPTREACMAISLKIKFEETSGLVTLAIPYVNLEPIASKLSNEQWNTRYSSRQPEEIQEAHRRNFKEVEFDLVAKLASIELSMEELLLLQKGDILDLENRVRNPIELFIANQHKFMVSPGLKGKHKAVTIQKEVSKE